LKRNNAKIKQIFVRLEAKKSVFSLVSLRSERLEIRSETKTNEAKTAKRKQQSKTKWEPKNCEYKSQEGQNLIVLKLLLKCMGSTDLF
jgi:hypothetical protein